MTPDAGASVLSALERTAQGFFDKARSEDRREPAAAYMADALVELCKSKSPKRSIPDVTLFVSAEALIRGTLGDDEVCEIPGIGAVSLARARSMIGDCFLKFVVTKGVDIATVGHAGRTIPSHIWTGLHARDRMMCVVPGCGMRHGLEADHWQVPFHEGGKSSLENLALLCTYHHRLKTHRGWRLVGGPGNWELLEPEDPAEWFDSPPAARAVMDSS